MPGLLKVCFPFREISYTLHQVEKSVEVGLMEWGSGTPFAPHQPRSSPKEGWEGAGATMQLHQPVTASWPGVTPLAITHKLCTTSLLKNFRDTVSYKDSLGLSASPSLHNVWAGYSCSASLRGLLIQTVHIMQKLRPSRHYGNSHPNTVSNAYLFHSLVQILRLLQSPLFQTIPQCLRLSMWDFLCTTNIQRS